MMTSGRKVCNIPPDAGEVGDGVAVLVAVGVLVAVAVGVLVAVAVGVFVGWESAAN